MYRQLSDLLRLCTLKIVDGAGHGTGFFVASNLILTCAHVVKGAQEKKTSVQVRWNNQAYEARITAYRSEEDVALLEVSIIDHPWVPLDEQEKPAAFDTVYSYGYPDNHPDGDPATFELEGIAGEQGERLKYKMGQVRPGFSGAPLLNMRTGFVCGLIQKTRNREIDLGGQGIPASTILLVFPELKAVPKDSTWITAHRAEDTKGHTSSAESIFPVWMIPYPRNSVFTGREEMLTYLANALKAGQATALSQPQAISGLGGIGKTQVTVEYAYQHRQNYQAVFWVLADMRESLVSGYIAIARLLNLPEKDEQDQTIIVEAVMHWLTTRTEWLLILDNADDLTIVREFIPSVFGGHILLTTRAQAMGRLAHRVEMDTMPQNIGAWFLLRRAALIAPDATLEQASQEEQDLAMQMSGELDGLPLALDQAGAYLEETGMDLVSYWHLYQRYRADLLRRRGGLVADHPEPVATTWSLSFQRIQENNPAAADLLRLCAYFAPDAIAEEILTADASVLGPVLAPMISDTFQLNQVIEVLRAYSLIRRNPREKTLSVHRLVQAVLQDAMEEREQQTWAERVMRAINVAFPDPEYTTWEQCERLLIQALKATQLIEEYHFTHWEAGRLLMVSASYLRGRARYSEAEPLFVRALHIREQSLGPKHPDVASSLNGLADLYWQQGKYEQAEPLFVRALHIRESLSPDTAYSLNGLANLYREQGKYEQAEPLYVRALDIFEQQLGPSHPDMAMSLNDLGLLYWQQGKYEQAEQLFQRALDIFEQQLGPSHPDTALGLNNLASLYREQGKYEQAEQLFQRALDIVEQQLGPSHPKMASSLDNLAVIYVTQGKYEQAELLSQRALGIYEQQLGPSHPDTAINLNNLAGIYGLKASMSRPSSCFNMPWTSLSNS